MFEINSKKIDFKKDNEIISKTINLDNNLDLFILISYKNGNLWSLVLNKIIDSIIDKISPKNAYKDFSNSLENINSLIKNIRKDEDELDIIVAILNKNNLLFSTIWNASCYLVNRSFEIIEITEKAENRKDFSFISDWTLNDWEFIIMWTKRILNFLSNSDIIDWIGSEDIEWFNSNIENVLLSEISESNIWIISFRFSFFDNKQDKSNINIITNKAISIFDNIIIKKIIAIFLIIKEEISKKSSIVKNLLFIFFILLSLFLLYNTLSGVIWITTKEKAKIESKENLIKAKEYVKVASQNIWDSKLFEENIKKAEEITAEIKKQDLYLNDVNKILDDISIIKKSFNHVETFDENESVVYKDDYKDSIKILELWKKYYVVKKKWIDWPIVSWKWWSKNDFGKLSKDEYFIDATISWSKILLLTNMWKIVSFTKNGYFNFEDVKWQTSWEEISNIEWYDWNIYTISKDKLNIYKHKYNWTAYLEKEDFLKEEDKKNIWKILNIAIDWWIFIIKEDLSIAKAFKIPYKVENLTINKLPKNYNLENSNVWLITRTDLNYIYMFLNNKVWVFKPNTNNYKSTKSLDYIWQIEWKNNKIIDFDVIHDWEIVVLNETWLYKLNFDITGDNRLMIN